MATYYLSSTGSNTAPYDTEAKAATSVWTIRGVGGFSVTDTIILCSDVSETTFDGGLYTKMCNMEAKPGLAVRPKITYNSNSGPYLGSISSPLSIKGIEFVHDNPPAPMFLGSLVHIENCILSNSSNSPLFSGLLAGSTISSNLIIIKAPSTMSIATSGGTTLYTNNTFVCVSEISSPLFAAGSGGDTFINNIFYTPNTKSQVAISPIQVGTHIENSSRNIIFAPVGKFLFWDGSVLTDGINNVRVDPLFLEMVEYTLKRISPAIKAGAGGVNIGWDQVTIGLPEDAPLGLVTSAPAKSCAGNLLSDSDSGGGIDTTNTNDYSSGLYNLGNLRR